MGMINTQQIAISEECLPLEWVSKPSKPKDWFERDKNELKYLKNISIELFIDSILINRNEYLGKVEKCIDESKDILKLDSNWDGENAEKISKDTWKSATKFLKKIASEIYSDRDIGIPLPEISPCADGSIDIFWTEEKFKLLINIIVLSGKFKSDFYGEKKSVDGDFIMTKGKIQSADSLKNHLKAFF